MVLKPFFAALAVAGGLLGCAGAYAPTAAVNQVQPLSGYSLRVDYSSDVPEVYYVLSGPAQSYERLRLNDQFRSALDEYARRKSPPGARPVTLKVHLLDVSTSYKEIGAPMGNGHHPMSIVMREIEGFADAPEELTKGVTLRFRVALEGGEKQFQPREVRAEATEVIDRRHFDRWSYDYSDVIAAAIRNGVAAVDRAVSETVG